MPGLSVSDVVNVQIEMAPVALPVRNFGALLIAGPSDVIDVSERLREYATLTEVAGDFGTTAPEYLAADDFFSQAPQPSLCYIGRFAQTATRAILHGAILSPAQQASLLQSLLLVTNGTMTITIDGTVRNVSASPAILYGGVFASTAQSNLITTLKAITAGGFAITVNGSLHQVTGMNFSSIVTLTDAATVIGNALTAATVAGTATWVTATGQFEIKTTATGTSQTISYASAPSSGTDVSADLQLQAGLGATVQQGAAGMNFSGITNLNGAASIVAAALTGGNCFFNGEQFNIESLSNGPTSTLSYATPSGTGQDISALLGLTQTSGATPPVNGIAAETALAAAAALRMHPEWYCLTYAVTTPLTISDYVAVGQFIEGCSPASIFAYTSEDTGCINSVVTTDIMSTMQSLTLSRSFGQYCSSDPYAVCSLFGRFATVDYQGSNTVITGKFKVEPGVVGEQLTETQAATLRAKNGNVYVYYSNDVAIIQEAVMANGYFIDERTDLDWLANQIQTDLFNVLYTSLTKIPQTDAGIHVLTTTVANSCHQGVVNGTIAGGQWNGPPLGQLSTGQQLPTGFYVYAPQVATQPQSIREQRIAPTIQAAVKLAGAVHFSDVIVAVNR